MRAALETASANLMLRNGILLGRTTNTLGAENAQMDLEFAPDEDRDGFYQTVGRRLAQLQHLPKADAQRLCSGLIERSLRFGPHAADAGVLISAAHLDLGDHVRAHGLRAYTKRIEEDVGNRLLLLPLAHFFWTKEMHESRA